MSRVALVSMVVALVAASLVGAASVSAAPVVQRPGGPIDIFAVGAGGQLLHKSFDMTGRWQPSASGFEVLGSGLAGTPAALVRRNGVLDVFARGADGALEHAWLTTSGAWRPIPSGSFETLGPGLAGDPQVIQAADGTIHVFARDAAGGLAHKSASGAGGWPATSIGPFEVLGSGLTGNPAVVQRHNGTLDVFARGSGGELLHKWLPAGGSWQPDDGFEALGAGLAGSPTALVREDGTLDVFARGPGGGLLHTWLPASGGWQPSASTFEVLGSGLAGDPQAVQTANGNVNVFARDAAGGLAHKWMLPGGLWLPSPFGPFEVLGSGPSGGMTGSPAVIQRATGPLDVYVSGRGGELARKWFGDDVGWQPSQFGPFEALGTGLAPTSFDAQPPAAPSGVSATAGVRAATVSWAPTGFDGNEAILDYEVRSSPDGVTQSVPWPATSVVVSGLREGVASTFTVRARNAVGYGPESATNAVTPTPPAQTTTAATTTTPAPPTTTTTTTFTTTVFATTTPTTTSTPVTTTTQTQTRTQTQTQTTTTVAGPKTRKVVRCLVPSVHGLTLRSAKARIRARHCGVGRVKTRVSGRKLRGRVVAQTPRAGSLHTKGARVTLWLGRGPKR
jgi:hypothetical protein